MKKLVSLIGILALLLGNTVLAQNDEETNNVMTVKSVTWEPSIQTNGENKLLKVKVDFHYEGDSIDIGYDYHFGISCQIIRNRRGGTKYLFYEIQDLYLDDPEISGPKDLSQTFVFSFSPTEFNIAKKRSVRCNPSYTSSELVKTVFDPKTGSANKTVKASNNTWKKAY